MKNRIARLREAKGLSQSELARILHLSPQTVQQWESGKTEPKRSRYLALADALGVSTEELTRDVAPPGYAEMENRLLGMHKCSTAENSPPYHLFSNDLDARLFKIIMKLDTDKKKSIDRFII